MRIEYYTTMGHWAKIITQSNFSNSILFIDWASDSFIDTTILKDIVAIWHIKPKNIKYYDNSTTSKAAF